MKILIVSSFLLFKETRFGGCKRLYYLVNALSKFVDLDIICFDLCNENEYYRQPENLKIINVIQCNKPKLFKRVAYSPFDSANLDPKTREEVKKLLQTRKYDSVLLFFPLSLSLIDDIKPFCKRIVYLEDDLIIERYRVLLNSCKNPLKYFLRAYRYWQLKAFYNAKLKAVKKVICISSEESSIFKRMFPHCETFILTYGIDISDFHFIQQKSSLRTVGYIGNYHHLPNLDSIKYLLHELLPLLKKEKIKVFIAGKNIPSEIINQHRNEESLVFLENPDLLEFYSNIRIFINPIVSGRGTRTKVIESAAFGIPVISTPLGAEGLENLIIPTFSDANSFIKKLVEILYDDKQWEEISLSNRKTIVENYTVDKLIVRLLDFIA